jgi:predicted transcriptional regulator
MLLLRIGARAKYLQAYYNIYNTSRLITRVNPHTFCCTHFPREKNYPDQEKKEKGYDADELRIIDHGRAREPFITTGFEPASEAGESNAKAFHQNN